MLLATSSSSLQPYFRHQLSLSTNSSRIIFLTSFSGTGNSSSAISAPPGTPAATTGDTPRPDIGGAPEAVDGEVVVAAEVVAVVGGATSLPEADVSLVNKGTHEIALDGGITPNPLPTTTTDASPSTGTRCANKP